MEVISVRKVLTVTDCNEGNSDQAAINVTKEFMEIFSDEDFKNERAIEFFDKHNNKYILDAKYFPKSKQNRLKNQYNKFIKDNSLKSGDFLIMTRYRYFDKKEDVEKKDILLDIIKVVQILYLNLIKVKRYLKDHIILKNLKIILD